jgi:uncharacterized protein
MMMTRLAALAAAATFALPAVAQDRSDWPNSLTIGTASQGGTYFVYGNGFASYMSEALGVNATGEVTGGPVQNVTLVETGDHLMGLVTMGPAYDAWIGNSELAPGLEHRSIRALFPMYQTPFQVIALRSSGIDLGLRPPGQARVGRPRRRHARHLLAAVHGSRGRDRRRVQCRRRRRGGQLQDGLIDAFAFAAGVPISAFAELAASQDVVMFGFTEDELAQVLEAFPAMAPLTIPAGTYAGHDYDQPTVALWNFAIAHQDMPDSLAYEITKLAMENPDRMVQIHAAASETLRENWDKNTFMPFHPGAVQYFEEAGITIPDNLR